MLGAGAARPARRQAARGHPAPDRDSSDRDGSDLIAADRGAADDAGPEQDQDQLRYVFPVAGEASFGSSHAGYRATDMFADCGSPVVAVTDGQVLEVSRIDRYDPDGVQGPDNGGLSVSVRGDDGVRYYGSHLSALAAGIDRGVRVRAGQRLGAVGRTGNANNVCHLHFGISPPCAGTGDWWMRRGVIWPAPYLRAWRRGEARSAAAAVAAVRCSKRPS